MEFNTKEIPRQETTLNPVGKMKCIPYNPKPELIKRYLKRPISNELSQSPLPAKKLTLSKVSIEKNALSMMHEMYRGLEFKIVNQEGPSNAPTFTASVVINGIVYEGKGRNKKAAKHNAAEAALRSQVQLKNPLAESPDLCVRKDAVDFTVDVLDKEICNFDSSKTVSNNCFTTVSVTNGGSGRNGVSDTSPQGNSKLIPPGKNPVLLLNELEPNTKYELVSEEGSGSKKFKTVVTVKGQSFEGIGSSKKSSKAAAARSALLVKFNIKIPNLPTLNPLKPFCPGTTEDTEMSQIFADHISKLINNKFQALMKDNPTYVRRKILAGFVMSKAYDLDSCEVLTVSTGTKCVNGERISANGTVLNDSHAEIVSRRCLCNFFYSELEKHLSPDTEKDSIFKKNERGFQIDPQYKFHLYINSAPCGDSRMFSPHDDKHLVDKHPNRKARGLLRTKIECGEGTIPVKPLEALQTWDGVLLGERLLTMSCSDKIAKWNVVGLQGALLANFIEPVYLDSIVLGSLFHPSHLYRAVCGRIENTISGLPPPYRLNKPTLSTVVNPEVRQVGKAPNYSVNWNVGEPEVEIVNSVHGRTEQNRISRISKCKLFYRFLNLAGKIPMIGEENLIQGSQMYSHCKEKAVSFQLAKGEALKAFLKAHLGNWVKKPMEVDQFEWDVESLRDLFLADKTEEKPS